MSKGYWRTDKLTEQFNPGKCATDRVKEYVSTWEGRCYQFGIPDEVPRKIAAIGRAPSWQAVAIALLKNDLNLYGLGFFKALLATTTANHCKGEHCYNWHFP